jgi:phosphatidate cytidylyltransferase
MRDGTGGSGLDLADPPSRRAARWNDLNRRVMSALVLLPVALLCVWIGGYAFLLVVSTASLVLAYEWLGMCGYRSSDRMIFWFPVSLVAIAISAGLGQAGAGLLVVLIGSVVAALFPGDVVPQSRHDGLGTPTPSRARLNLAFGVPYLGLAAVALPWLRDDPVAGLANTLFVLALVWGSDIGAYGVGRMLGGPKLAPALSPGKTWSGAIGGLVSAALAGLAIAAGFSSGFSPPHVIGLALGLGIISQAGDLLESALKRYFGVKDSGHIIPGHGGLLDRVDALLAVAPVAALLAFSVGRGVVLWR